MSVRATILDETTNMQEYIRKMARSKELLSEGFRQLKPREGEKEEEEHLY